MSDKNMNDISQYLTFTISDEMYALNVLNVKEVQEFSSLTKVPRMPEYMRGIINLRGNVVPVIDLKTKFGLGFTEKNIDTSIIVSEIQLDDKNVTMGLLADSVREVIDLKDSEIEPTPYIGTKIDTAFIKGMGRKDESFIILLEINKVLTISEIKMVASSNTKETE